MSQLTPARLFNTCAYPSPEGSPPAATCCARVAARFPSITRMLGWPMSVLGHGRRSRHAGALEERAQHVRPVGDHAVRIEREQPLHVRRFVDGPRNHPQPQGMRLLDEWRIEIPIVRAPAARA